MSAWISSAFLNCLIASSRCLKPVNVTIAQVDVRARGDRMVVQARLGADLERALEQLARLLEVEVLVLVDRLLVELGDLLDRGRIFGLGPAPWPRFASVASVRATRQTDRRLA